MSKPNSIRDEIVDLAGILADIQLRLDNVVERLDESEGEVVTHWQSRYEELERTSQESVNSAKWLRHMNKDLERKLNTQEVQIDNALSARQAAFKRLKHARKVIRDLLEERRDMSSPKSGLLSQEDIDEALYGGHEIPSPPSDTSRTVRGVTTSGQLLIGVSNPPSPQRNTPGPIFSPILPNSWLSPVHAKSPVQQSNSESSTLIRLSPTSSKNSSSTLSIHFKRPPGSSTVRKGPFSLKKLHKYLGLEDDAMVSLRSFRRSEEMKMQAHITQIAGSNINVAFLYDPIFVEGEEKSYAIYWSRPEVNKALEDKILQEKEKDPVFHTFTYPLKEKKAWFYIGAHQWSVVNSLGDLWPLEGKNRTTMIKKLCERTHGAVDEVRMATMLDTRELHQISIELVGLANTVSQDFAQNKLNRSPHQLERSNAGSVQSE